MPSPLRLLSADAGCRPIRCVVVIVAAAAVVGCGFSATPSVLTQLREARRLALDLSVQFSKADDAGNLAVMSDTDVASTAAGDEERRARAVGEQDAEALRPILQWLQYGAEQEALSNFTSRFAEY